MVLAAGLGKRMRPITDTMPKPLVKIAGKTLLDWGLDSLEAAGVARAVVNVHYLSEQIVAHVAHRRAPKIVISD
ncbi:MAG: nucleotidyltransferase family protein, partial [Mesorhizobium sp.]